MEELNLTLKVQSEEITPPLSPLRCVRRFSALSALALDRLYSPLGDGDGAALAPVSWKVRSGTLSHPCLDLPSN